MSDQRGNYNQGRNGAQGNYQNYGRGGPGQNNNEYGRDRGSYGQGQSYGSSSWQGSHGQNGGAGGQNYQRSYSQGDQGAAQGGYARQGGAGYGAPGGVGGNGGTNVVNVPWDQYELRRRDEHGAVCAFLLKVGSWITFARNFVFNIIFLLMIFVLFGGYMAVKSLTENGISLSSNTVEQINTQAVGAEVLYFDLSGPVSEVPFSSSSLDNLQRELEQALYGRQSHEIIAIEKALNLVANDEKIKKVIISVDNMGPINMSMAQRIGTAMDNARALKRRSSDPEFKREVVTVGYGYNQASYAIAAHADRVVMDPLGEIDFRGIAMTSLYFKDMLEKANVTPYIFRAGHFKSAVEPFMLNGMSYDVRREYQALAFKSWELYKQALAARPQTTRANILPEANTYVQMIQRVGGSRGELQLAQGLVDEITPIDTYFQRLAQEVNVDLDAPYRPAIITYQDYLMRHHMRTNGNTRVGALSQIDVKTVNTPGSAESSIMSSAAGRIAAAVLKGLSPEAAQAAASSTRAALPAASAASTVPAAGSAASAAGAAAADSGAAATASVASASGNAASITGRVDVAAGGPAARAAAVGTAAPVGSAGTAGHADKIAAADSSNILQFDEIKTISEAARQIERRMQQGNKNVRGSGRVAVIYGIGEIMDVGERPTDFTPDNIIPLIEQAQNDSNVNAVVLYLNSPGGSVTASERIRRALETFQKHSLKPLIVSMNGTAASGAYWIASQAEKIYATPTTITGSIGVFGIGFGAHRLLNRYGAYQDGVVTNELALTAIAREMPYSQQAMLNMSVEDTYKTFIELVARNRGIKPNDYEIYAEGQIFLADDALSIGLVDAVGNLSDAISYAASQARIRPDGIEIDHIAPGSGSGMGAFDSIMFGAAQAWLPDEVTYSLVKMRQISRMTRAERPQMMAISPVTSPEL